MEDRRRAWLNCDGRGDGRSVAQQPERPRDVDDEVVAGRTAAQRERRPEQRSSEATAEARRVRRNAQQRERRARQRGLQVSEASEGSAAVPVGVQLGPLAPLMGAIRERSAVGQQRIDPQSSEAIAEVRRIRRNAQQRERRARQRGLQVSEVSEGSAAVPVGVQQGPLTPLRDADRESGAVEQQVLDRQRQARRDRSDRRRLQNDETSRELSARILDAHSLTSDELEWLAKSQHYLQDPRLALAYYYCCGVDPASFVFGDETLCGEDGEATRSRVSTMLDDCPGAADIAECQRLVAASAAEATSIWACAACGRILLQTNSDDVYFSSLSQLDSVLLSDSERALLVEEIPEPALRRYRQLYFFGDSIYYLIPELVRDPEKIPLCKKCRADPRTNEFSVAAGHDYGRIGLLPSLTDAALWCISPARCFGLEISLSGKHSRGHAICFPTNGPFELARQLPRVDSGGAPRVTFIGSRELWRVQRKRFSTIYAIPPDDVYTWLTVLSGINNVFREEEIEVVDTPKRRELLRAMASDIEAGTHVSESAVVAVIDEEAGADSSDLEACSSDAGCEVVIRASAVLPHIEQSDPGVVHDVVNAMASAVGGLQNEPGSNPPVIPIKCGRSPFVEWVNNAKLLASVFPDLFLAGSRPLPSGPLPKRYVDHFMHYWDGRFEKSVAFTSMLFNQMQRHAAVQKAARVGVTHGKTMKKFGDLISTQKFKDALAFAKEQPESKEAKRLNALLLRLLSLVGGSVPFSPFERAATRPKLGAMRYRYGVALHWVTIAPPEHDDLLLHRIAALRKKTAWNDLDCVFSRKECKFEDFPLSLRESARARLKISARYPALSAQVFERRVKSLTHDIIRCRDSGSTRASRNYLAAERGVYGRCAAFNAVVEPQADGRLHAHMTVYASALSPCLLTRVASCAELLPRAKRYLSGVSCTTISEKTRDWCDMWKENHGGRLPRAFEIAVPSAASDFAGFTAAAEKRAIASNVHSHSGTCRKGKRGQYICRLSRPAGVHEGDTQPLCIRVEKPGVLGKRIRAAFIVNPVDGAIARALDARLTYPNKKIMRQRLHGAVVWEQHRPARDAMFVETNLALACLASSHTNSALMNGEDAGDMVEEYQQAYMTKEQGGLKHATAVMYTALTDIQRHPSVAEDSGTSLRNAKHLSTRTVNAFTGGNEWSHSLMAYALSGYRSFLSSDQFWYVFPYKLVQSVAELRAATTPSLADAENGDPEQTAADGTGGVAVADPMQEHDDRSIPEQLASLAASADDNNDRAYSAPTEVSGTGARMFKMENGAVQFLTQAESYQHRGEAFKDYSPLEFEVIVDILPRCDRGQGIMGKGRPRRQGFDLAMDHPLHTEYQGFIRAKFKTPMLGGAPPPPMQKNGQASPALSKYLICLLTPWDAEGPVHELTPAGLSRLCKAWNAVGASFLDRQRYRYLDNLLKKHWRSTQNEQACSEWRSRNADFWNGLEPQTAQELSSLNCTGSPPDRASDPLGLDDVAQLASAAAAKDTVAAGAVRALKADFWALVPEQVASGPPEPTRPAPVFKSHQRDGIDLSRMARAVHNMKPRGDPVQGTDVEDEERGSASGPSGCAPTTVDDRDRDLCSPDQRVLFDRVIQSIDGNGGLRQTLTLLHGGGGTGKSALIRRITKALRKNGIKAVNTCPTGVGASHLENGQTFHSAFKTLRKNELSANNLALLRLTFTERVWLVVVDEVSMFSSEFLVLLDARLRSIYRNDFPFGGRSIILSGDFLQLEVTFRTSLCKMLYQDIRSSANLKARALFRRFEACFLTCQHRAADCLVQQDILEACRVLPSEYPAGARWTAAEKRRFQPFNDLVIQTVTSELDMETIANDPSWLDEMTILVTSNFDKAVLTGCMARVFARRQRRLLFRWRRALKKDVSSELQSLIYDEDTNPELFGYFAVGAPAQVLDNNSGNVGWSVANGTPCKLHSLAWQDPEMQSRVDDAIAAARISRTEVVDLPFPPDFINVQLLDAAGELLIGDEWPAENNLETEEVELPDGVKCKKSVIIPVGVVRNPTRKPTVQLGMGVLANSVEVEFVLHAVDLAQVMTVWKAQGATLKKVVLNLEPLRRTAPSWGFEHIYVAISRVTAVRNLRCLPLTGAFREHRLRNLRPNIYTTRWRMDNQRSV